MHDRMGKEAGNPVVTAAERRLGLMTAVHRKKVVHSDGLEVVGYFFRKLVREEIDELVSDFQQSGINGHAHCRGREGLAD